jgi:hypothetical protein
MSFVIAAPEMMTAAASDLAGLESAVRQLERCGRVPRIRRPLQSGTSSWLRSKTSRA